MEELLQMIIRFDLKGLLITPTTNGLIQFLRYVFVGGMATIVDWGILFLLTDKAGLHHLISAVFGFFAGLAANYILSKLFVFKASRSRFSKSGEFIGYLLIGAIGLGITELLIYSLTDRIGWHYMVGKMIATVVVLVWNYLARKKLLYIYS